MMKLLKETMAGLLTTGIGSIVFGLGGIPLGLVVGLIIVVYVVVQVASDSSTVPSL